MEKPTKLIVLVESESLFLPHLLAKMAREGIIEQIIILSPSFSYIVLKKIIVRLINAFGIITFFNICLSAALGAITNVLYKYKFYSIKKISQIYKIPLKTVQTLHSQQLYDLLEQNKENIIFTQVSQKIKSDLLDKGIFWNKHCSLLPSYKGVYPIFWALLNQEPELGVSIHVMNEDFDEGLVLSQAHISNCNLTFFQAYHHLYDITADLIIDLCLHNLKYKVNNDRKSSYYSFPSSLDRKHFQKEHQFGFPFRFHPSVKPKI
jgi:methionyl-tRNA formyltransferase